MNLVASQSYIDAAFAMAFPSALPEEGRYLIVLDGYFDESGTHDASETITVAGYLAHVNSWRPFETKWKEALAEYKLDFFHMSEFAHRRSGYDWPEDMRRERLGHLIEIINEFTWHSFGVGIPKKLFESVFTGRARRFIDGPYGFASWLIVNLVSRELDRLDLETGVAYVFEDGAPGKGELLTMYEGLPTFSGGKEALHVLSLRLEDKRRFVPLQAADILAYELYLDRPKQNNPELRRTPLQLLDTGIWHLMTEPNLRAYAAVIDMLAAGDIGPDMSPDIWKSLGPDR